MKIHTLTNGATVITTSPHQFKFSDGTTAEPQDKDLCEQLTLARTMTVASVIKGMKLNRVTMALNEVQLKLLGKMSASADIVLVPFPVLTALREQGVRDTFPNVVAFNATAETQRSTPTEKTVDINNWSY